MESIIELLPPLLASIGGVFPILLESLPTSFDAKSKPLAMILLVSVVWVIYIFMLSLGYNYTFFSPSITVSLLIMGVTALGILFWNMSGTKSKLSSFRTILLYLFSMSCLVAGFSNHLLMQDNIVLHFATNETCKSLEEIQWKDAEGTPVQLGYVESVFGTGVVWPHEHFAEIEKFVLFCSNTTPGKPAEEYIILKKEGVYRPWGAGESYEFRK
jgi:hypothetical protein